MNEFTEQSVRVLRDSGVRLDANETATLERVLTQLLSTVHTDLYKPLIGRTLMPPDNEVAADADDYVYQVNTHIGEAKVGANAADDPPTVGVNAREVAGKVYPVTAAFEYNINDLARAARTGQNLSTVKAGIASKAIERGIDKMLALGKTDAPGESNLVTRGLLNNKDIADGTGAANSRVVTFTDEWDEAAPDADIILGELFTLANKPQLDTDGALVADMMVLPLPRFQMINSTKVGVDSDRTILEWFKLNSPVKTVVPWASANLLGANSTGRAIVFAKDISVLSSVIPKEFDMLPPQAVNYIFKVPCYARCGGVKVVQPFGAAYADHAA